MATITIDGQSLQIGDDERINMIQAAERLGIKIPYYCWHPGLSVVASCRMCLVEIGQKTPQGQVQMQPRLVPACQTPARDGTVMITDSEKVRENRRAVEEYLLLDHPVDCPICDRAGECLLQDYYYQHGRNERRDVPQPFSSRRKELGPQISLFIDRCVMCSRCVRFTREISGTAELQVVQRGNHAEIDVFPGHPIDNKLSGNVVDLCPVGALCLKDFLYQQRVWFLQSHVSICTGCSAGCSIRIEENRGTVYRLKPRHNPAVNGWWICDEGRLSYKQAAAANRLRAPQRRGDGGLQEASWAEILPAASQALAEAVQRHGGAALVGVLSPQLACEEAWLLAKFLKSLSPEVKLALGPLPVVGQDEFFPQLPGGQTPSKPTFVIRAEKCPNRRGIEAILQGLEGGVRSFDDVLDEIRGGLIRGAVLTGGYPAPWLNEEQADVLARLEPSVLVDSFAWPFSPRVQYLLPGAVWAEKEGSYVNQAGRLQVTERAVRPAGGARAEGRIFWEWAHRPRLFSAADVRAELAAQLPFFAAAGGRVGEWGIPLAQPAG